MKNILNRIAKIFSTAIFVLLVMVIILIVGYIVRIKFLASNNRLGEVKINLFTILSQSMYPTIEAGDIIITYKNNNNIYNIGDIITFTSTGNISNGITITHRVTDIYKVNNLYTYKTKGDNNNTEDLSTVEAENVIGRVIFRVPKAGYIQQFLVTRTGWIVAIVLPSFGIIIYDILKLFRLVGKKKDDKKLVEDEEVLKRKKALDEVLKENE